MNSIDFIIRKENEITKIDLSKKNFLNIFYKINSIEDLLYYINNNTIVVRTYERLLSLAIIEYIENIKEYRDEVNEIIKKYYKIYHNKILTTDKMNEIMDYIIKYKKMFPIKKYL